MSQKSNKVIITCAITGSIHTPTMSDALPVTPDEIAQFVQPHPTLSESFGETVQALTGRGLHLG